MLEAAVQAEIDELVLALVSQVRAEARKYHQRAPQALERDELVGVGNDALVWAAANWERYCLRNGYSPTATNYFRAYALRRIRGAILDHLRGQDWVPRTVRTRFKVIQQASESQGGGCEADLAAGTGMEATVIRATLAAVARRPLSLDERTEDLPGQAEVEAQAVAGSVLRAIGAARSGLSLEAQAVLALRFYRGMSVAQIAEALRLPEHQVQELNDSSVLVIHQAMLGQVA